MKAEKPPLGVVPAMITSRARIKELAEAITRYAQYFGSEHKEIDHIRSWAREIELHCDILQITESEKMKCDN